MCAKTVKVEYNEQLCRPKEDNERQHELLDAVCQQPQVLSQRADVSEKNLQSEQQAWHCVVKEEEPDHAHIKEEEDESDVTKFSLTCVVVKSEDQGHWSPLHPSQSEENRGAEPLSSSSSQHMKTEGDGDRCGGSQSDSLLAPQSESDDTTSHSSDDDEHSKVMEKGAERQPIRGKGRGGAAKEVKKRGGARPKIPNEIRAAVLDYVINHGLTFKEAGQRVTPALTRSTVGSMVRVLRHQNRINRLPQNGGRDKLFNANQEAAIVAMVAANNAIRLRDIKEAIIADKLTFPDIDNVSLSTIDRVLKHKNVALKKVFRVPFQRNSDAVKEARCRYVQRIMELEGDGKNLQFIFVDEAGFNLAKVTRKGKRFIGQRATVTAPEQRGANITMCAAISNDGVLCHTAIIGPLNTERLIVFLDSLLRRLIPPGEGEPSGSGVPSYVVVWDNVDFHRSDLVNEWFADRPRMTMQFLPAYSPFLSPIEEFFSTWRWQVLDCHSHRGMSLLDAMNASCQAINAETCQGWIRRARRFFPRCIAREDIHCDVDENLWPNVKELVD
ncbi:uncharacterized protein LOC133417554 isoform X1 [Phycodurus eques]|uniref:uncharacterized protein LOC133417554 isoform X1 n=1 Tax=Phycodurus eques TaxID=693459 RepID=UPI002ACD85C2|nr:uncharacterized protein LOC133417554 isoform X1 [Phycodurus eques]